MLKYWCQGEQHSLVGATKSLQWTKDKKTHLNRSKNRDERTGYG